RHRRTARGVPRARRQSEHRSGEAATMRRALLFAATVCIAGCDRTAERAEWDGLSSDRQRSGDVSVPQVQTTTLQAGPQVPRPTMRNPWADAVDEGERFYRAFNCAGCHGALGGGGMG